MRRYHHLLRGIGGGSDTVRLHSPLRYLLVGPGTKFSALDWTDRFSGNSPPKGFFALRIRVVHFVS